MSKVSKVQVQLSFVKPLPLPSKPRALSYNVTPNLLICQATNGNQASSKGVTLEPSFPQSTSVNIPPSLLSTTVYYNIPLVPEHYNSDETFPLAHRNDGDGYVLAVSFPSKREEESWIRGRFVRTRPFFIESRTKKRVYRGLYGTPGAVGVTAPVKPKASSAKGIFVWGKSPNSRLVTFGLRTLPLAISRDVLVTRGPTALGSILTDSEELLEQRATELSVSPFWSNGRLVTVGMSRTAAGKTIGAFVCELNEQLETVNRFPKIPVSGASTIIAATACEKFIVLALHRIKEESGGLFSAVFGTGKLKNAPIVDVDFGTMLIVLSRSSGRYATYMLKKTILTKLLSASSTTGGLHINGIELSRQTSSEAMRISTIADASCGCLWDSNENGSNAFSSDFISLSLQLKEDGKAMEVITSEKEINSFGNDVMVTDLVQSPFELSKRGTQSRETALIVFHKTKKRSGVATIREDRAELVKMWFVGERGTRFSGGCTSPDGCFISVLLTKEGDSGQGATLAIFELENVENGPVDRVFLDGRKFGTLKESVGGVWTAESCSWYTDGKKAVKSSYEMFDSHDWNDINSNFSSLGL